MKLNETAKARLRMAGVSQAAWVRKNDWADGKWHGDACGCPDDRCIGFHHDEHDECGCLSALLAEHSATPSGEGKALKRAGYEPARIQPIIDATREAAQRTRCATVKDNQDQREPC
jgi:hypothetical protein